MLGIAKLLTCEDAQLRAYAAKYLSDNIDGFMVLLKCTTARYIMSELAPDGQAYEQSMDFMSHNYDFFYTLDGFIDMTSGTVDAHYDDVLLGCLQIYYTSFATGFSARDESAPAFLRILDALKANLEVTTMLSPDDKQRTRTEIETLLQTIVQAMETGSAPAL